MAKIMKWTAIISALLTAGCAVLSLYGNGDVFLTLAITFGTILYHILMRLLVGGAVHIIMKNRADGANKWYREKCFEKKLYEKLRVKRWKGKLPTYAPSTFSLKEHSISELIGASCQAELVHEIIILLSFLPLLAVKCFGAFWVFFATSLLSACVDGLFVMIQRYNRPRLRRLERNKIQR